MTDERYRDTLQPLAAFCDQHGYRWRWNIEQRAQWHATVQIIDPTQTDRRDWMRAWMGAAGHDDLSSLERAARYAVELAQQKLDNAAMRAGDKI